MSSLENWILCQDEKCFLRPDIHSISMTHEDMLMPKKIRKSFCPPLETSNSIETL